MPYAWLDPEVFLVHRGVTVYHVYKDDRPDNRMNWRFTTDRLSDEHNAEAYFDCRAVADRLKGQFTPELLADLHDPKVEAVRAVVTAGIDAGLIVPHEEPGKKTADGKEMKRVALTVRFNVWLPRDVVPVRVSLDENGDGLDVVTSTGKTVRGPWAEKYETVSVEDNDDGSDTAQKGRTMTTPQKPALVYLTGASATGKTMLASELAVRLGASIHTGAARGVIAKWPLTPQQMLGGGCEEKAPMDEYFKFQMAVLAAQTELEVEASRKLTDRRSVILDRGVDHLAYTSHFCPRQFASPPALVRDYLRAFWRRLGHEYSQYVVLVVYLPPVQEYLDKARDERPPELQPFLTDSTVYGVDAAIKGLLVPFACEGRVLSLAGVTDLTQRADAVMERLRVLAYPRSEQHELAT